MRTAPRTARSASRSQGGVRPTTAVETASALAIKVTSSRRVHPLPPLPLCRRKSFRYRRPRLVLEGVRMGSLFLGDDVHLDLGGDLAMQLHVHRELTQRLDGLGE